MHWRYMPLLVLAAMVVIVSVMVFSIRKHIEVVNISSSGIEREFLLYIPDSYHASDEHVPLVINLHGHASNHWQQLIYADFRSIADKEGFIIMLPLGLKYAVSNGRYWNAHYNQAEHSDLLFIEKALDLVCRTYRIDQKRIYATGFSSGAAMCISLAWDLDSRIAAIAPVSCTRTSGFPESSVNTSPVSVMLIHGTDDRFVKYDGGELSVNTFVSVNEEMHMWEDFNNIRGERQITPAFGDDTNSSTSVTMARSINETTGAEVIHYKIVNAGHTWPGSKRWLQVVLSGFGKTNSRLNASEEIWKFFASHELYS